MDHNACDRRLAELEAERDRLLAELSRLRAEIANEHETQRLFMLAATGFGNASLALKVELDRLREAIPSPDQVEPRRTGPDPGESVDE